MRRLSILLLVVVSALIVSASSSAAPTLKPTETKWVKLSAVWLAGIAQADARLYAAVQDPNAPWEAIDDELYILEKCRSALDLVGLPKGKVKTTAIIWRQACDEFEQFVYYFRLGATTQESTWQVAFQASFNFYQNGWRLIYNGISAAPYPWNIRLCVPVGGC